MHLLSPMVSQFILEKFLANHYGQQKRSKYGLGLKALSVLFTLAGLVFLIIALDQWMISMYGAAAGNAMTGGAMLVLTVLIVIGLALSKERVHVQDHRAEERLTETIIALIEDLGREVEGPILDNPKMAMLIAAVAGLMAGRKL